ncbi:unnamed protein product [Paramecium sonneborni]|uniref:Uncharacterized protein n=1 Tax=Paramecium sonneborni TaxID=65129 RepID=A0A8S1RRE3_9CILI|nr:unnamed protein product [Paramecium sonneborni]
MKQKEDLYVVLASLKDLDQQIYKAIIDMFRKETVSDCLKYLSDNENHSHCESKKIKIMMNIKRQVKDHELQQKELLWRLLRRISKRSNLKNIKVDQIVQFQKFLVQLTTVDEIFIQCGQQV